MQVTESQLKFNTQFQRIFTHEVRVPIRKVLDPLQWDGDIWVELEAKDIEFIISDEVIFPE